MRAAMALLPLFPAPDLPAPPAGMETASSTSQVSTRTAPQAPGPDVAPPAAAIQPISAARAAGLQQLAHLWRADEVAHAAGRDGTVASGFAALDAELPGGGWPQGQLTELLLDAPGIGELSLLAPVLARCTQDARACVWVLPCERAASTALPTLPYPPALAAAGIDLARALFVQPETPREAFWAIEQSLRAAHLGALVGWLPQSPSSPRESEFRALRRLQLLAGRKPAPVFLLRDTRALHAPSPAALRLQLAARDGELSITILKRRGRPLLEPVTLQVHPVRWREAQVAAPAAQTPAVQPQPAGLMRQAAQVAQRWSAKAIFSH
jgi:cell division inhibitor SulA/protein ImuA